MSVTTCSEPAKHKAECTNPGRTMQNAPVDAHSGVTLTCFLSSVGDTEDLTSAHSPPAATGFGANDQGCVSLVVPCARLAPCAPNVTVLMAAVIMPPSLLLLKLGSCVMNLS